MKQLLLIFWVSGLGCLFLASGASDVKDEKKHLSSDSYRRDIYHAKSNFKCPLQFGVYPDPTDCGHFYVCVIGIAARKSCPSRFLHFDINLKRCVSFLIATCGSDKTSPPTAATTTTTASTKTGDNFKCPKFMGTYPHPNDCSKYYNCVVYVPVLKECPEDQLFDTAKSSCKPKKEVDCGTRQRPGYTTAISTDLTVTEIVSTVSTEDSINESTTEAINTDDTIDESTTEAINTDDTNDESTTEATDDVINESTTEVISTEDVTETVTEEIISTTLRPTGPPEHDCDEEDVDCIITETGDIDNWFTCPHDIGAYSHPSSDKLFIFCMNWIPSVKKCGMDRVFSTELSACIETVDHEN